MSCVATVMGVCASVLVCMCALLRTCVPCHPAVCYFPVRACVCSSREGGCGGRLVNCGLWSGTYFHPGAPTGLFKIKHPVFFFCFSM